MVVIGASGTPAVLPARTLAERGYKGSVYFNHGVANNDFLRVGGKDIEGAFVPTSPVVVAAALPAGHPAKAVALDYVKRYESVYGAGSVSAFGSYTWDAWLELAQAIPIARRGQAGHARVPRRPARSARGPARPARVERRRQHVEERPPRARPARPRHRQGRRQQVEARLTGVRPTATPAA